MVSHRIDVSSSIVVYLTADGYPSTAWPFDGGEFVYIGKIFPLPPIVWSTSFGWFFCMFSTSFGNSINAGRYFTAAAGSDPASPVSDWLIKYVGVAIVAGISIVHYRLVNIGLWANNILACLKMMFLFILILATTGKLAEYGEDDPQPGKADYASKLIHHQQILF